MIVVVEGVDVDVDVDVVVVVGARRSGHHKLHYSEKNTRNTRTVSVREASKQCSARAAVAIVIMSQHHLKQDDASTVSNRCCIFSFHAFSISAKRNFQRTTSQVPEHNLCQSCSLPPSLLPSSASPPLLLSSSTLLFPPTSSLLPSYEQSTSDEFKDLKVAVARMPHFTA